MHEFINTFIRVILKVLAQPEFTVFCIFAMFMYVYIKGKERQHRITFSEINDKLLLFASETNLGQFLGDFEFYQDESVPKLYLQNKDRSISIIGLELDKGYDLFHVYRAKNTEEPQHRHFGSKELFVLLSGRILITQLNENQGNISTCLLENRLDYCLINKKTYHKIQYLENSEFFVIAHPPLLSRIGKTYGKAKQTIERIASRFKKGC